VDNSKEEKKEFHYDCKVNAVVASGGSRENSITNSDATEWEKSNVYYLVECELRQRKPEIYRHLIGLIKSLLK